MFYDKQGRELNVQEWAVLLNSPENYKRVAETQLENGTWISTVWLGLNHRFYGDGPPIIFETAVFPNKENMSSIDMRRYCTEAEALAGHAELVNLWSLDQAAESPDNPDLQRWIKQEQLAKDEEE